MQWENIVQKVAPFVVKIETPYGHGTGFLYVCNEDKSIVGIATAAHVIDRADEWKEPIRIKNNKNEEIVFIEDQERIIFINYPNDSAVILLSRRSINVPDPFIQLLPDDRPLSIGCEVGWLGFPSIESQALCFFTGSISARKENIHAYLIDGVAISGVSGGPVLYSTDTEGIQIVGIITAYRVSRTGGDALPGLSIARDVVHFHDIIQELKSMDDAKKKKQEVEETPQKKEEK